MFRLPQRSATRFAVGLSLLLHALLLALPMRFDARREAAPAPPAVQTLTLRLAVARDAGRSATPARPQATMPRQRVTSPRSTALDRPPASPAMPLPAEAAAPIAPAASTAVIDLDALRAQARDLARRPEEPRTPVGGERPAAQHAAPDLLDRPRLDAVARRIGKPLRVAAEEVLADGSRMIRFTGNVCLHIPAHLPSAQENPFGPTVLLPTNCPD